MSTNAETDPLKEKIINLLNICYNNTDVQTKQEFATVVGTNYLQLYRWMEGKTLPRKEALKKICEVCDVDFMTFMALEDYDRNPHKLMTLSNLDSLYNRSEAESDRDSSEIIIGFAAIIVYEQLKHLGVSMEFSSIGEPEDILPLNRAQINFAKPQLRDLHIVIYGGSGNLFMRCYSDLNERDIYNSRVTITDINRLSILIKENYLK
jgi:transcriptional regulator with XRE-family HTH domain